MSIILLPWQRTCWWTFFVLCIFWLFPMTSEFAGAQIQDYDPSEPSLSDASLHMLPDPDYCASLAQDGDFLWVATPAGAVRWNLKDHTSRLFVSDPDWNMEYARKRNLVGDTYQYDEASVKVYFEKWLRNAVEDIHVLSSGIVLVDTVNGAMIVRGDQSQYYSSVDEAISVLYKTLPTGRCGHLFPVDKKGRLWRVTKTGPSYMDTTEVKCYDGKAWKKIEQPTCERFRGDTIERIVADSKGNIWGGGEGGIYQRVNDQWHQEIDGFFTEAYISPRGNIWFLGGGDVARYDGKAWSFVEGKGRYEMVQPASTFLGSQKGIQETSDGKLWFDSLDMGLICFDGKGFTSLPKIKEITAMRSGPDGQGWISNIYGGLWSYQDGQWKAVKVPTIVDGPRVIEDILIRQDGSLFLATLNGLLHRKEGTWYVMRFGKKTQEIKAQAGTKQVTTSRRAPVVDVEEIYRSYLEEEGKNLISATNEQLAKDIMEGEFPSMIISYYRLISRDKARGEACLTNRIRKRVADNLHTEAWITHMEFMLYGPPAIKPLLEIVKTGTAEERSFALGALTQYSDPHLANELLKLLDDSKQKDISLYSAAAWTAILAGNPKGMDLLIEGATVEHLNQLFPSLEETDGLLFRDRIRKSLEAVTENYEDIPDDWSASKWKAWWRKHRSTWEKPTFSEPSGSPEGIDMEQATHKMFEEIAQRMERQPNSKR
jgi:hypothetical protein